MVDHKKPTKRFSDLAPPERGPHEHVAQALDVYESLVHEDRLTYWKQLGTPTRGHLGRMIGRDLEKYFAKDTLPDSIKDEFIVLYSRESFAGRTRRMEFEELCQVEELFQGDIFHDPPPERLRDNELIIHSRLRYSDREANKARLRQEGFGKELALITEEETRTARLRAKYNDRVAARRIERQAHSEPAVSNEGHERANTLEADRLLWRREAKDKCDNDINNWRQVENNPEDWLLARATCIKADAKRIRTESSQSGTGKQWIDIMNDSNQWKAMARKAKDARVNIAEGSFAVAPTADPEAIRSLLLCAKNNQRTISAFQALSPEDEEIRARERAVERILLEEAKHDRGYGFTVSEIILKKIDEHSSSSFGVGNTNLMVKRHMLRDILFNENRMESPLKRCHNDGKCIRYFHFPANNMQWVEEAITRYYGEAAGVYDWRGDKNYRERSSDLLCRRYWTAQQHGGVLEPVHARHMRPHCSYVSTDSPEVPVSVGAPSRRPTKSNNFIIFMPYLHWETDKRRENIATEIAAVTLAQKPGKVVNANLQHNVVGLVNTLDRRADGKKSTSYKPNETAPMRPVHGLARYLMHASRVYQDMDIDSDVSLLQARLHEEPPLHTRRTLDQSYFWNLENTGHRDRDQVVYRATKGGGSIHRTARVVMVDQLWLYILDEHTIFTFFPRRWGRNKPDPSGVHRGIRAQLNHLGEGDIESVYDLALLIMNQCSNVFFDKTRPTDDRPEVFDIFLNAIGYVSEMKTSAFQGLWKHLDRLDNERLGYKRKDESEVVNDDASSRTFLNINPEGRLLKETHDIIEELRMMKRIYDHQLKIAKQFLKLLENRIEHNGPARRVLRQQASHTVIAANGNPEPSTPNKSDSDDERTVFCPYGESSTTRKAADFIDDIKSRRMELESLEDSAQDISKQLQDLLSLKQQQAAIVQARAGLDRADASIKQGRSIMLFTIVTIIFLPLSFMSSIFGMNSKELSGPDGGTMSLIHQFTLMFLISFGVIVTSLALAFSKWIRSFYNYGETLFFAYVVNKTGLGKLWKQLFGAFNAEALNKKREAVRIRVNRWEREKEQEETKGLQTKQKEDKAPANRNLPV